jgi:hypothetical protein
LFECCVHAWRSGFDRPGRPSIYTALGTSAILGAQALGAALLDQMQP